MHAEGSAALDLRGATGLSIDARARQANVDMLLRRKDEDAVPPSRAAAALAAALSPVLGGAAGMGRIDAHVAVDAAILGGDTLSGLSATLAARPGASPAARLEVGLPGDSRIKVDGEIETGAAARFVGALDFSSGDPGGLGRWAGLGAPELAAFVEALDQALPSARIAVSGRVEAAAVGVSGKAMRIALGDWFSPGRLR